MFALQAEAQSRASRAGRRRCGCACPSAASITRESPALRGNSRAPKILWRRPRTSTIQRGRWWQHSRPFLAMYPDTYRDEELYYMVDAHAGTRSGGSR
jgi:hypothetical protein